MNNRKYKRKVSKDVEILETMSDTTVRLRGWDYRHSPSQGMVEASRGNTTYTLTFNVQKEPENTLEHIQGLIDYIDALPNGRAKGLRLFTDNKRK